MKKKMMALIALPLAVGGAIAMSVPAQAISYHTECFPPAPGTTNPSLSYCQSTQRGTYKSADQHADAHGQIEFDPSIGTVTVYPVINDLNADGKGPRFRATLRDANDNVVQSVLIDGAQSASDGANINLGRGGGSNTPLKTGDYVNVTICNGGTDASPANCELHGPFN